MFTRRVVSLSILLLLVGMITTLSLWSQTTFGVVSGAVTDETGAAIPGVQVTLTSLSTEEKRQTTTGPDGRYQFVNLNPGSYGVAAEKSGFKRFSRQPIIVEVQQTVAIDIKMPVGAVTQTVEVTSASPLLQPETSSLGQVVGQRLTNNLPLNGRNVFNLVALAPSVIPQGGALSSPTGNNPFAWNNYQIGGAFAGQSASYLDGAPLNTGYLNLPSLIPTQSSVQEFKVQTNNLSPEWGRFAGGVVNLSTKSGGNQLHGELYEYFRNRILNANTFFDNEAGIERPAFTQNQFGGNAGGPLVIPHMYDGRNKTFWFFSLEGFRVRQGQSFVETVPTAAERTGDFSNLRDDSGNPVPIYDPLSTRQTGVDASGNPMYSRIPVTCDGRMNVICPSLLNATSLKLLNLWPMPNAAGQPFTNVNNYVTNASVGGNNNESVGRLDQVISDKQRVFGRFTNWNNLNLAIDPFGNGVCQDRCTETFDVYNGVIDDVYTFSPTMVADFRVSANRFNYARSNPTEDFDLTSVGWPASLNAQIAPNLRSVPIPVVNGYSDSLFSSNGAGSIIGAHDTDYDFSPSLTAVLGKHTLKLGYQLHIQQHNYFQTNDGSGSFNFDNGFTASSPFSGAGGNALASYLFGYASGGGNSLPAETAGQQLYQAWYLGDTWQVNDRVSLNFGIRYERLGPWSERYDRQSWFDPAATNPLAAETGLPLHGNIELVNSGSYKSRYNIHEGDLNFAPRVGFAVRIASNTVLRGGYGIFWLPTNVIWQLAPNNDPLNSIGTPYVSSLNGGITPFSNFSNPFPSGILQPPGRSSGFQQTFLGQGFSSPVPSNPYGYMQQWNFDIQHQIAGSLLFDIAYAGAKGTHLAQSSQFINQLPDQNLSLGTALVQPVANPFYGKVNSTSSLANPTISMGQLLLPYPQYTGLNIGGAGFGSSSYHSLQIKGQKRFQEGSTLLVAYTFSKLISNVDAVTGWLESGTGGIAGVQNWNNLRGERSISADDIPQRLVVSYALDIPVGHGKKYLANVHGVAGQAISGWGVEGVTTLQSGFPLQFGTAVNLTNSFGGGSRPNVVCSDASIGGSPESRLNQWFNTSCFTQPAAFTFGNEGRVDPKLRTDWIHNFDFSAFKDTKFGPDDRMNVQFRAEFFNLFNTPQFGAPGTTVGNAQYGVVSSQINNPRLVQFALRFLF
ncbi:MAG TPA: carboxypeptidase regulatory-like domain-containing protein [Bryobacteraceae bacterium]|nr:carboxypeptidase regulatory-like domain-containing protein [Bryobacteraceae bacterium]